MATSEIESALVAKAAGGDHAAFKELVERCDRLVTALLVDRIGRRDDVQDLRQEVFFRIYRGLESLRDHEVFLAWVRGICRNVVREYWAGRARSPGNLEEATEPIIEVDFDNESQSIEYAITKALGVLPARYREVLRLRYFARMSYEDIALTLSLSFTAVDALVRRAKARLKESVLPMLEREHLK